MVDGAFPGVEHMEIKIMESRKFCRELKDRVVISENRVMTSPAGDAGKIFSADIHSCSGEDRCSYRYECMYSLEGKNFDPGLIEIEE